LLDDGAVVEVASPLMVDVVAAPEAALGSADVVAVLEPY
jgi:hypothetical protein